ncbi:MAG TPA: type II toxin-antitoxin system RelE/ParE family toxin [Microvirga sp.]|nr:type II toxin-antitoxin system RelE/ParE family toxin [Microvirga sp.]
MEIHWFPDALADIDAIFNHIHADNPAAAREIISELRSTIDLLRENPKLGRSGRWPRTRELVMPPYVVAYREADAAITILAIYHSARMWPESWLRAHIEEGLKQVKNGQFASKEEVQRAFDSFGSEEPLEEPE